MARVVGMMGVLIVLAVGAWYYQQSAQSTGGQAGNPRSTVDVAGVHNDLIAFARGERMYYAREGKYASLAELEASHDISLLSSDHRGPYTYSISTTDASFTVTATYTGSQNPGVPESMSIDENMQLH